MVLGGARDPAQGSSVPSLHLSRSPEKAHNSWVEKKGFICMKTTYLGQNAHEHREESNLKEREQRSGFKPRTRVA